jgi:hypothetical protein
LTGFFARQMTWSLGIRQQLKARCAQGAEPLRPLSRTNLL